VQFAGQGGTVFSFFEQGYALEDAIGSDACWGVEVTMRVTCLSGVHSLTGWHCEFCPNTEGAFLQELGEVYAVSPMARRLVEHVAPILQELTTIEMAETGFYHHGMDVLEWIRNDADAPPPEYLAGSPISMYGAPPHPSNQVHRLPTIPYIP
jgi:hypothetical protein